MNRSGIEVVFVLTLGVQSSLSPNRVAVGFLACQCVTARLSRGTWVLAKQPVWNFPFDLLFGDVRGWLAGRTNWFRSVRFVVWLS